jgi:hypothetical protein
MYTSTNFTCFFSLHWHVFVVVVQKLAGNFFFFFLNILMKNEQLKIKIKMLKIQFVR